MVESTANDILVSFRGIQKSYDGESLIVRDLNLDIRRGEFLTLLGPSGSGKTTSLMMLAGFETPTAGEILLDGRAINNVPPHKRDMGMVFQNYALFPHMTVSENLAFPLSVRGMAKPDIKERVKRALAMVQLEGFRNRYPAQLAARGAGPRAGVRAAAGADGRTVGRTGQAAARADADGDQAPARAPRRHRGVRHPRPG